MVVDGVRDQLINLLAFPRQLVEEDLIDNADECPHELRFACDESHCLSCDLEEECRWLSDNDDFSPLHLRSIPRLVSALDTAITYVRGDAISWGHTYNCSCQVCEWLKKAQDMYDSMELSEVLLSESKKPRPESAKKFNRFWRLQSVKDSIVRLTNVRLHLLRSFQPK